MRNDAKLDTFLEPQGFTVTPVNVLWLSVWRRVLCILFFTVYYINCISFSHKYCCVCVFESEVRWIAWTHRESVRHTDRTRVHFHTSWSSLNRLCSVQMMLECVEDWPLAIRTLLIYFTRVLSHYLCNVTQRETLQNTRRVISAWWWYHSDRLHRSQII